MAERIHLELLVNKIPYHVEAEPCEFNDETRYKVRANANEEIFFIFDTEVGRYVPAGKAGGTFPDDLALEIGNELNRISLKNPRE